MNAQEITTTTVFSFQSVVIFLEPMSLFCSPLFSHLECLPFPLLFPESYSVNALKYCFLTTLTLYQKIFIPLGFEFSPIIAMMHKNNAVNNINSILLYNVFSTKSRNKKGRPQPPPYLIQVN